MLVSTDEKETAASFGARDRSSVARSGEARHHHRSDEARGQMLRVRIAVRAQLDRRSVLGLPAF